MRGLNYLLGSFIALTTIACSSPALSADEINEETNQITVKDKQTPIQEKNPAGEKIVTYAKEFLGKPYAWGGRDTSGNPGVDCLGLIYRSFSQTFGDDWKSYPVNPIDMVKSPKLGKPVEGLDGILYENVPDRLHLIQEGDMIYFLLGAYMVAETEVTEIEGERYGCWHTALSLGENQIIHAKPGREVREDLLSNIVFDALYVSRRTE
ncbi:MAG: NlpC/P60 family protein [archaeon]|nr:C40 family peptidase [Nanoarchaeota archaeon]